MQNIECEKKGKMILKNSALYCMFVAQELHKVLHKIGERKLTLKADRYKGVLS